MLYNLLNCQNSKTAQVSKIYLCGNNTTFKIGQTAQKYFCQRLQNIRKTDTGAIGYCYVEFNADKPLRDYIESVVRLYLSNKGYKLIGNDHFVRKYSVDRIKGLFLEVVTTALNELQIDYTVHHLKA